ncbi:unnamed protein product [Owenia fusiformis]|uniref:Uncharacterized protein n=1 Tax=Owenia fusiformis TaxID=6347 RepID=A0A8S4NCK7_OWEFU|nr:unnamed protein product [Owenia fusiformis]
MEQSKNTVQTSCCRVDKKEEKSCDDCKTKDAEINKLGKQIRELIEKMKHENQSKASLQKDLNCLGLLYNQLEEKYGHLGHIQREYWEAKFENRDEFVKKWEELDKFVHDTWEKDHEEHRYMHQVKCESDDVAARNRSLETQNIDLIQTNAHFRKEHERKNSEIDRLTKELNHSTSELKNLSERNFHLKKEWKEMQEGVQGVDEMSLEHDRILGIKHEAIEILEEEKKTLRTKMTEMEIQIDTVRGNHFQLTEQYCQLRNSLKETNKELKGAKDMASEYERTLKSNKDTIIKLEDEKNAMEINLAELKSNLERIEKDRLTENNKVNVATKDIGTSEIQNSSKWWHGVKKDKKLNNSGTKVNSSMKSNEGTVQKIEHIQAARPSKEEKREQQPMHDFDRRIDSSGGSLWRSQSAVSDKKPMKEKKQEQQPNPYSSGWSSWWSQSAVSDKKPIKEKKQEQQPNPYSGGSLWRSQSAVSDMKPMNEKNQDQQPNPYSSGGSLWRSQSAVSDEKPMKEKNQDQQPNPYSSGRSLWRSQSAVSDKKPMKEKNQEQQPNPYSSGGSLWRSQSAVSDKKPMNEKKQEQQTNPNSSDGSYCRKPMKENNQEKRPNPYSSAGCYGKKYQTEKDLATSDDADTLTIDSGVVSDAFSI